ncbi:transporter domain protein [Serratia plymuthica A30]|nr:transporter domain protein [Serratia plymuthica A30]
MYRWEALIIGVWGPDFCHESRNLHKLTIEVATSWWADCQRGPGIS